MVKDITKSQLDFLALEEVSDRAAETISGGATATVTSPILETELDAEDPLALPLLANEFMETFFGLMSPFSGLGELVPELPEPPGAGEVLGGSGIGQAVTGLIA